MKKADNTTLDFLILALKDFKEQCEDVITVTDALELNAWLDGYISALQSTVTALDLEVDVTYITVRLNTALVELQHTGKFMWI